MTDEKYQEYKKENSIPLPEEYYFPTPPEIDNNYMAMLKQKQRVQRLRRQGNKLNRKKTEYDLEQQSLF